MGIVLELGIFIVVLVWGVWQWREARAALEKTRADKARAQAEDGPAVADHADSRKASQAARNSPGTSK